MLHYEAGVLLVVGIPFGCYKLLDELKGLRPVFNHDLLIANQNQDRVLQVFVQPVKKGDELGIFLVFVNLVSVYFSLAHLNNIKLIVLFPLLAVLKYFK